MLFILVLLASIATPAIANDEYVGFPKPQSDFQAHIMAVGQYLTTHQMQQRSLAAVQYNLPFEVKADPAAAYRGKYLLIHGLNDSPYIFTDVAFELVKRGFDVRAILLPGHGSTPKAQLNISAHEWLDAAREQLHLWRTDELVPMYLGGFSMGAVIATTLAIEAEDIAGLLLFSPAFRSNMNGMLRWASIYSRFKPWVFGGMIIEDNPVKYNSIPINGAAQYYELTQNLKSSWNRKKLDVPVLAVASVEDSVLDIDYFKDVFKDKFISKQSWLILYSNELQETEHLQVEYRPSAYPALRILNQSHQSVLVAPNNKLYGKAGTVLVCNGNDWETFSGCLYSTERHWFGAQHTPSPDLLPVARTTYNPDFASMFAEFDSVFQINANVNK